MTTTEFNRPKAYAASQPSEMGAGADIYRRLERRPPKSKLGAAIPIIVLTACSIGGALAYLALAGEMIRRDDLPPADEMIGRDDPPPAPV